MLEPPFSFDAIMAPLGAERFFAEYEGKQPLHLKGAADKFAAVMTWARLNDLLGQATIWSHNTLSWCSTRSRSRRRATAPPRSAATAARCCAPIPTRSRSILQRGATLVANDIDHLSPGLTAFADAMERALGGKVQGNLYLSSRRRQGFGAHFDTHDVYAVHVEGTKTWHIYEGRAHDPIAHPLFKTLSREHHEKAKGAKLMDVHMEPGDLLYLPRGQYHDALADEGGTVHIAFGVTYPIGFDVMTLLFDRVAAEPEFRANLPRPDGPAAAAALAAHLAALGERIQTILAEPETAAQIAALQRGFRYPRHAYDLPGLLEQPAEDRFRVRAKGIRLVQQGGRYGLVQEGSRAATEVPAEVSADGRVGAGAAGVHARRAGAAFPERQSAQIAQLLRDLGAMRVTEPL